MLAVAGKSSWQSLEGKLKRQLTGGREKARERQRERERKIGRSTQVSYAGDSRAERALYVGSISIGNRNK